MKVTGKQKNSRNCLICGMENDAGVKAPFYNMEDGSVASLFEFRPHHQSYPDRTHGGMISAFLDEIAGRALWVKSPRLYGVTTSINVSFRKPVPYGVPLKARGKIIADSPMFFSAKAVICDMDDTVLAECTARYFKLSVEKAFDKSVHEDEEMCYDIQDGVTEIDFKNADFL